MARDPKPRSMKHKSTGDDDKGRSNSSNASNADEKENSAGTPALDSGQRMVERQPREKRSVSVGTRSNAVAAAILAQKQGYGMRLEKVEHGQEMKQPVVPSPAARRAKKRTEFNSSHPPQLQPAFVVYHPLMFQWVMWELKPGSRHQWSERLCRIASFDTVEDFWAVRNNTFPASRLPVGGDYFLFRAGINPDWEDPMNSNGGRWQAVLPTKSSNSVPEVTMVTKEPLLDMCWLELEMSAIGAQYGIDNFSICGVAAHVRKNSGDKVALWISDASDVGLRERVGRIFKSKLLPPGMRMSVSEYGGVSESRNNNKGATEKEQRMDGDIINVSFQPHTDSIKHYVDTAARDNQRRMSQVIPVH